VSTIGFLCLGDSTLIPDFGSLSHGLVRDCPFNTVVAGVPKWLILRLKNPPFIPFSATRFNLGMPLHPPSPALLLSRTQRRHSASLPLLEHGLRYLRFQA
ncbi:hypothetical protein Gorai_015201, partial [Gossypium raimondii]|nr:hypothetical protein [Gossypium raimondii]